jgi:hypothetical protein
MSQQHPGKLNTPQPEPLRERMSKEPLIRGVCFTYDMHVSIANTMSMFFGTTAMNVCL